MILALQLLLIIVTPALVLGIYRWTRSQAPSDNIQQ